MAISGMIAERTKGILPITWDALLGDSRYGEDFLQVAIDTAKETATGTVVDPDDEDIAPYNYQVRDYIAKLAVLQIIPAGVDFWMNRTIAETAEGTNEITTFTDRASQLQQLYKLLLDEVKALEDEIAEILDYTRPSRVGIPLINTLNDEFLTPSHQEYPRPYRATDRS